MCTVGGESASCIPGEKATELSSHRCDTGGLVSHCHHFSSFSRVFFSSTFYGCARAPREITMKLCLRDKNMPTTINICLRRRTNPPGTRMRAREFRRRDFAYNDIIGKFFRTNSRVTSNCFPPSPIVYPRLLLNDEKRHYSYQKYF